MIIVLTGPDTYRSRERLHQLRDAFLKKYDSTGMNVSSFDPSGFTFEAFESAVKSQGFLSSRRFIIVERPFDVDTKTQKSIATLVKEKQIPEDTIVVFWVGEEQKKTRKKSEATPSPLIDIFLKVKNREVFDLLEPNEVERWIETFVRSHKGSIERAATQHLAAAVGSDLWLASNELTKLLHQHDGKISQADAQSSIAAAEEENIFALTDALSRKDGRGALRLLEQQLDSGANELYLLTMIMRQIRILLSVGDIAASEPNRATIATRLKLHPFVVQKALQQVRTFSQSELLKAHGDLVGIDRKLKSTRDNPRALLEMFIVNACRR